MTGGLPSFPRTKASVVQSASDLPAVVGVARRERYSQHPVAPTDGAPGKTRDHVRAELAVAQTTGQVVAARERTPHELFPADYAAPRSSPRMAPAGSGWRRAVNGPLDPEPRRRAGICVWWHLLADDRRAPRKAGLRGSYFCECSICHKNVYSSASMYAT